MWNVGGNSRISKRLVRTGLGNMPAPASTGGGSGLRPSGNCNSATLLYVYLFLTVKFYE